MGRSESKQVVNQGTSQSAQDQAQAAQSFGAGMSGLQQYQGDVNQFKASNPFGIGGQYATDQSRINADSSNAGSNSLADAMRLNATRTGENAASYAPALAEAQRSAARDQATAESKADQARIGAEATYNEKGLQYQGLAPDLASRLYGSGTSGATGNLNAASGAARTPGFFDSFLPALAQGAGSAAGGYFAGQK